MICIKYSNNHSQQQDSKCRIILLFNIYQYTMQHCTYFGISHDWSSWGVECGVFKSYMNADNPLNFNRYINGKPQENLTIECYKCNMVFWAYHFPYLLTILFWNSIENVFFGICNVFEWIIINLIYNTKYYVNEEQKLYSI